MKWSRTFLKNLLVRKIVKLVDPQAETIDQYLSYVLLNSFYGNYYSYVTKVLSYVVGYNTDVLALCCT